MPVIIYLLEDEQELSLGILIRLKRINNFCSLHACFVQYCYDLDTLSYTFDHIWTNLLTQCTLVPVPVFCCFSISVFPHIKSARKIRENSDKNQRDGSFEKSPGGARGEPGGPRRPPGAAPPLAPPGGAWSTSGCPPSPIYSPSRENSRRRTLFRKLAS